MQSPFCDPAHATALAKPAARHNVDNANHTDAKRHQATNRIEISKSLPTVFLWSRLDQYQ